MKFDDMKFDPVTKPRHYVEQSATIEPIEVLRWAPFDLGNALKYMIRAGHKDDALQDLKKAAWYLDCADRSYDFQPKAYERFFKRYSTILEQFPNMPKPFAEYLSISDLKEKVKSMIQAMETKNEIRR